jgi:shikimate dehydrogenase
VFAKVGKILLLAKKTLKIFKKIFMKKLGLIGYPLSHSFSKRYFQEKFTKEAITDYEYELYPIEDIRSFPELLNSQPELIGLNVTIPHKQSVIPYLDSLHSVAKEIGAVNTILIKDNQKIGYNTDYWGFMQSLQNWLGERIAHIQALVLGNGGASKAVQVALRSLRIPFQLVSRETSSNTISYQEIQAQHIQQHPLIINTTPLGMYPHTEKFPDIPYDYLTKEHFLYDLVYNPEETMFLQKGSQKNAKTKNGLEMLYLQAEAAWNIWNE